MSQAAFGFSAYIADRAHNFAQREWIPGEIDRRLADPDGPRHFNIPKELGN
jgi:hypothetical protein